MSTQTRSSTEFRRQFRTKIQIGDPVIWIYSAGDEGRCERVIQDELEAMRDAGGTDIALACWDIANGATWNRDCEDPMQALREAAGQPGNMAVIMRDFHVLLNGQGNFPLRRLLMELCKQTMLTNDEKIRPLLIIADTPVPHPDIKDFCSVVDFALPNFEEMREEAVLYAQESIRRTAEAAGRDTSVADMSEELVERITTSLLGLTAEEGERILRESAAECGGLNERVLDVISRQKIGVVRKIQGLTYIPYDQIPDMSEIGGMDKYLEYLRQGKRTYSRHAREVARMKRPRGVVLVGPAGTGKTTVAKMTAKDMGLDLILFDPSAMQDSLVGASEKNQAAAVNVINAMPNCCVVIDEIDKVFSGAHENQKTDSGVSSRMLSGLLHFLSERDLGPDSQSRTFVIVTANRVDGLPPELLRMGRFDETFSTDLPDEDDRRAILDIQLRNNLIDPAVYGKALDGVVKRSEDFSGAELEGTVEKARRKAYDSRMVAWEEAGSNADQLPAFEDCLPTIDELLETVATVIPNAKINEGDVGKIREFCRTKATPVSGRHERRAARRTKRVDTGSK